MQARYMDIPGYRIAFVVRFEILDHISLLKPIGDFESTCQTLTQRYVDPSMDEHERVKFGPRVFGQVEGSYTVLWSVRSTQTT
jgi:hypothetical protein